MEKHDVSDHSDDHCRAESETFFDFGSGLKICNKYRKHWKSCLGKFWQGCFLFWRCIMFSCAKKKIYFCHVKCVKLNLSFLILKCKRLIYSYCEMYILIAISHLDPRNDFFSLQTIYSFQFLSSFSIWTFISFLDFYFFFGDLILDFFKVFDQNRLSKQMN